MKTLSIRYLSPLEECDPADDNVDVHVTFEDGKQFVFTFATPRNLYRCMENEQIDYFFGEPIVFVKNLKKENIEEALLKIATENNGRWLTVYGTPSSD